MIRKIQVILAGLVVLTAIFAPAATLAFDPFSAACTDINAADTSTVCLDKGQGTDNPLTGKNGLFRGIAGVIALISGIIAIILILISGLRYVTSGGDPAKTKSAKDTIIAVVVGLVIIMLADSIISLVLSKVIS